MLTANTNHNSKDPILLKSIVAIMGLNLSVEQIIEELRLLTTVPNYVDAICLAGTLNFTVERMETDLEFQLRQNQIQRRLEHERNSKTQALEALLKQKQKAIDKVTEIDTNIARLSATMETQDGT